MKQLETYAAAVRLALLACGEDPCAVRVLMPGITNEEGVRVCRPQVVVNNAAVRLWPDTIEVKGHALGLARVVNNGLIHASGENVATYYGSTH